MRYLAVLSLMAAVLPLSADHSPPESPSPRKASLIQGLSELHHPVTTENPLAQAFFDQGLRLIYAFNHAEALLAFQRAAELDPKMSMAYWGMALAVGPNYNLDAEVAALKEAYASIQKAAELAKDGPVHERDYIAALARRYVAEPTPEDKAERAKAYKEAMAELARKYPDDLDAATLAAEAAMNLNPWKLWSLDGQPHEGTLEIVKALEGVLDRDPTHIGALHYYIHAIEASPWPERGLAAAQRLEHLAPAAGHLVHMPSHIYLRVGDYAEAARINEKAAAVDGAYVAKYGVEGVYPLMYYSHNLHFAAIAHALQGRAADAKAWADRLAAHVGPHVEAMPMLEFFMVVPTLIRVRFHEWDAILAQPKPDARQTIALAIWHFARGMAYAAQGNGEEAEIELSAFKKVHDGMPADLAFGDINKAKDVLAIPGLLLEAKLAVRDLEFAFALDRLRQAVAAEDQLGYIEPADWPFPTRETLGAVQLRVGMAKDAEATFRADLVRHRRNPRSLHGLVRSLKAQGRDHEASLVQRQLDAAWRHATVQMVLEDS